MPDFGVILTVTALMVASFGLILSMGGILVYRGSSNKGLSELDAKTIISLQAQNEAQEKQMEAQEKQIQALEKKVARCEGVISTIRYTLKDRRRLRLEVKDDFVMLVDERTGAEITVPIHTGPLSKEEKEDRP